MSSEREFVEAISRAPDDDAPRLVYADWLEERGDPRGEFIRTQCELATRACTPSRQAELRQREAELVAEFGSVWFEPFEKCKAKAVFRRGLIEAITISAAGFIEHAERLLALAPIRNLAITDLGEQVDRILKTNLLTRIRVLNLSSNSVGNTGARRIARCAYLTNLVELRLTHAAIENTGARELAGSPNIGQLQILFLGGNSLGDSRFLDLAQSEHLINLQKLFLTSNQIGNAAAEILTRPEILPIFSVAFR